MNSNSSEDIKRAANPLVSVIIPAYNAGRFIRRAVISVLNQTYHNCEIIVVNDGSADDTEEIIRSLQTLSAGITLINQKNCGSAAARNEGIRAAKGEYLAFLDADDIWHPTKIEKQMALMLRTSPSVGLIYTWSRMIDNEDMIDGATGTPAYNCGHVLNDLIVYNFIGNGSVALVRRSCLPKPGPFDVDQSGNDDLLFYIKIAGKYELALVAEFLVGYRWNTGQNKSQNLERLTTSRVQMVEKVVALYPQIPARRLKWCHASLSLAIAQVQFKKGEVLKAFKTLAPALGKSPSYLLSPPFRRALILAARWGYRKISAHQNAKVSFWEIDTKIADEID